MTLRDLFPAWFVEVLPRSTSSFRWHAHPVLEEDGSRSGGARISADGTLLSVPTRLPTEAGELDGPTLDLQVAMADGRVTNLGSAQWQRAMERAAPLARGECALVRDLIARDPAYYRDILADPRASRDLLVACEAPPPGLLERIGALFGSFFGKLTGLLFGDGERGRG